MAGTEAGVPEYVVEALRDEQCRSIVSRVAAADGTMSLRELANYLATGDGGGGDLTRSPPSKKLLVKLHHVYLPKLDEAGLVEYAPGKRRVAYAGEWVLDDPDDVEDLVADIEAAAEALG